MVVRNVAASKRVGNFGLKKGYRFLNPLAEFFVRPDRKRTEIKTIVENHLLAFNLSDPEDLEIVDESVHRVNDLLTGAFFGIGVDVVNLRMEYGAHFVGDNCRPVIMLSSELGPDTMTLWDINTGKVLDAYLAAIRDKLTLGFNLPSDARSSGCRDRILPDRTRFKRPAGGSCGDSSPG